ncbi:MAG: PDZ domain-containing protein [Cytophagales bacterium]|nr:PDZ domain-containing protein [Cytophagales bacterium]
MKKLITLGFLSLSGILFAQKPLTTTPLVLFGDHIFIHLSVDGSDPLDFIFDTGDGLTVIDTEVAISLNLQLNHTKKETSAQGTIKGTLIDHNYIKLNDILLEEDIQVYATSLDHLELSIGRNIDGIIGYDLLQHYGVMIDYTNSKFNLYDGETFNYTGIGEKLSMGLEKFSPFIVATTTLNNGETITGQYFVNTGAGTTVDFNTKFANTNGIVDKTGNHYSYLVKGLSYDETLHYEGRVQQFQFGKIHYENLPIGISQVKKGIQGHKKMAGIIGNRILKNFNVIFDYTNESIYFERHVKNSNIFQVNACGFEIQLDKDAENVIVHRVYEIGPARGAGLKEGDKLISVNGVNAAEMTIPELNRLLNEAGTSVEIITKGYRMEKKVTLELKELI